MKRILFVLIGLAFMISGLFAQEYYSGGAQPAGFVPDNAMQQQHAFVQNNGNNGEANLDALMPKGYTPPSQGSGTGTREFTGCLYCAIPEGEPDIPDNGTDVTNGGCNVTPNLFTPIQMGDVFCGRGNGYVTATGDARDTDWYIFTLTQTTTIFWTGIANFSCVFYIVTGTCDAPNVIASAVPAPGTVGVATTTLGAGTYWLFVAPSSYGADPALDGDYMVTFTDHNPGTPDNWCYQCLDCAIPEGEPPLVDNIGDLTNYGCNGAEFEPDRPSLFSTINMGDVICGTSEQYSYNNISFRDTDWYKYVVTSDQTVYYSGTADFSLQLIIIKGPCNAQVSYGATTVSPGEVGTIMSNLTPGEYYFWAGPSDWIPTNEGTYMITLNPIPPRENVADWCNNMVPVSNWALYIGLGLIAAFAIFRFRKLI
jgi:hypothetical protein